MKEVKCFVESLSSAGMTRYETCAPLPEVLAALDVELSYGIGYSCLHDWYIEYLSQLQYLSFGFGGGGDEQNDRLPISIHGRV